ncbi:MAG: O-antigen ligase family protein [Clostridia bacterium]|nr:O-antigen ligase family protein [Clostridia bacterium]
MNTQTLEKNKRTGDFLDRLLSGPAFYTLFTFIAIRANDLKKWERSIFGLSDFDPRQFFPFLRVPLWVLCGVVLGMYVWRWITEKIKRKQPMLLCFFGMHAALIAMTLVFHGASGYWLHWVCGLCLMLMVDMGLQRERQSLLEGISLAFLLWLALNVPARLLWPAGLNYKQAELVWFIDPVENAEALFVPEWLIGNRVFYYRLAFPGLCLEMIRAQVKHGRYTARTGVVFALTLFAVFTQRGGTALVGFALLLAMLLWFNRRALPRCATPAAMLGASVLLFIGLHFLHIQENLGFLIRDRLGKDTDLTYRTHIWTETLKIIRNYPFTGVGLLPVEYMRRLFGSTFVQPLNHTHNQLLELMLHGGVLALLPYLGMVWIATREAMRFRRSAAVKTATILLMVFLFMGTVDIFHNEPVYYALFMLLARSDSLAESGKRLPRISAAERLKRDIRKLAGK